MKKAGIDPEESKPYSPELISREIRRHWLKKWWLPVTGIAATVSLFLVIRNLHSTTAGVKTSKTGIETNVSAISQVTTKAGSRMRVQLPDGSSVWLNASSYLSYGQEFGRTIREVNLTGEAFFDVVKDASRPFIIHTKTIDVKVLGTRFNIKAYPDEATTETSLLKGSVEVTIKNRNNQKMNLKPNQKIVVTNNMIVAGSEEKAPVAQALVFLQPLTYYPTDSAITETAWVNNILRFQENETFGEVALKMERWYGVTIHFADEEVAGYRIYGSFTKETISQALEALHFGFKFNYKIEGNDITITK